jgi:hypothetical protein
MRCGRRSTRAESRFTVTPARSSAKGLPAFLA